MPLLLILSSLIISMVLLSIFIVVVNRPVLKLTATSLFETEMQTKGKIQSQKQKRFFTIIVFVACLCTCGLWASTVTPAGPWSTEVMAQAVFKPPALRHTYKSGSIRNIINTPGATITITLDHNINKAETFTETSYTVKNLTKASDIDKAPSIVIATAKLNNPINTPITSATLDDESNSTIPSTNIDETSNSTITSAIVDDSTNSTLTSAKVEEDTKSSVTNMSANDEKANNNTYASVTNRTITSANVSTFTLMNDPVKGQLLHFSIRAVDVSGRPKTSGGDVWFLTVSSIDKQFFTSGRVVDHQNGSYSAFVYAGWIGTAMIKLKLVYTSLATNFIETNYWPISQPRVYWSAHFMEATSNKTETSTCYIENVKWNSSEVCAYPNPTAMGNHTSFVCQKPPSLPCVSLNDYLVNSGKTNKAVGNLGKGNMWLFKGCMEYMNGVSNLTLNKALAEINSEPLKTCTPDEDNPLSHGYWLKKKWVSLVCQTKQWTATEAGRCLQNKYVILLGDSTTRQWYTDLVKLLGENNSLKGFELVVKTKYIPKFNTTVFWHFHPWTIGSVRKYIKNLRYEVDILDELNTTNCTKYVIVVSPWAHFTQWAKSAYLERLELLKQAILRFQSRCHGVPVVVRGPHPRLELIGTPKNLFSAADYMLYKMNDIMRDAFKDIGVHYLDIWDLNLSHPSSNTIHMPHEVIEQELAMLLSYICNEK